MIDLDIVSMANPWDFILNEVFVPVTRKGKDMVCLNALKETSTGWHTMEVLVEVLLCLRAQAVCDGTLLIYRRQELLWMSGVLRFAAAHCRL